MQLLFKVIQDIGLGVGIGLAFFIIPFGLLTLAHMLPWLIVKVLSKYPLIRYVFFKKSESTFNNFRYDKQIYIDDCRPSQVIERLKKDGLQSLFRYDNLPKTPIKLPRKDKDVNQNGTLP
jgi:hypothetical protein